MTELKQHLHTLCLNAIRQRMENAQQAIQSAEDSSGEETKSSAGDKYETGREMMQQEKNRAMAQLTEANKLLVALQRIGTGSQPAKVEEGSVVMTDNGNFYMAVGAGTLIFGGKNYFAISAASPIGAKMTGLKAGDRFEMNGKKYQILELV